MLAKRLKVAKETAKLEEYYYATLQVIIPCSWFYYPFCPLKKRLKVAKEVVKLVELYYYATLQVIFRAAVNHFARPIVHSSVRPCWIRCTRCLRRLPSWRNTTALLYR